MSHQLLSAARQLTGLALWSWDLRTGVLSWSAEMFAMLGLPAGQPVTIGQWQDWLHPDDRDRLAEQDARAVEAGRPWQVIFRVLPPDGSVRHLKAWCDPVVEDGAVVAVFGATLDVTDSERGAFELEESRLLLDGAVQLTGLAFWTARTDGSQLWWSPTMHALAGTDPQNHDRDRDLFLNMIDEQDRGPVLAAVADVQASGRPAEVTAWMQAQDGQRRHLRIWLDVHPGRDGDVRGIWGACLDVTEEQHTLDALRANREEFRLAFDEAPNGMAMIEVDADLAQRRDRRARVQIRRVNRALVDLLGMSQSPDTSKEASQFVHPHDRDKFWELVCRSLEPGSGVHADEVRVLHADGRTLKAWIHAATAGDATVTARVVLHVMDVTALRATQAELQTLAMTDSVTKLANRTALEQRVLEVLPGVTPERGLGLMLLDLDRFKVVNDSLGHVAGDCLLVEVARRLVGAVPPSALVVRLGGDEFAVLIHPCPSAQGLTDLAGLVRARLARPYQLPGDLVLVATTSIGVTWSDSPEQGMDSLYREADLALYQAKDNGRDTVAAFDDALRARADARIQGERNLREALAFEGVRLFLQPIVSLPDGVLVSGEALARLQHPTLGLLMPNDFIEIAEDTGLVVEIDSRITELAVAALARTDGGPAPRIAVNVSPRTLDHPGYLRRLTRALAQHAVDPSRLIVEVTESSLLDATGQRAAELEKIQALGIEVGIDDFGTGYSALAYLDRFRLDFLKIDRSFVSRLGTSSQADAVVGAIISLAHAHGMSVTAEGVETQEQADRLAALDCDRGQGWLFGRPAQI